MVRQVLMVALVVLGLAGTVAADGFAGVYTAGSDGKNVLQLTQSGTRVSGTYTVGSTRLRITGVATGGKVDGTATLDPAPGSFLVVLRIEGDRVIGEITEREETGGGGPHETERIVFHRTGAMTAAPTTAGSRSAADSAPNASPGLGRSELTNLADRIQQNFEPQPVKVLVQGTPPLTHASITAIAELLRLTFGVELTESEYAATTSVFVASYQSGDPPTRALLASEWQRLLTELKPSTGKVGEQATLKVRTVLAHRFEAGAQANIPWAAVMNATIQKRTTTIATMKGPVPAYGKRADLHTQMTEADLDASLEMLYFMWSRAVATPRW